MPEKSDLDSGVVTYTAFNHGPRNAISFGGNYQLIKNLFFSVRGYLSQGVDVSRLAFDPSKLLGGGPVQSKSTPYVLLDAGLAWENVLTYFSVSAFVYNILDRRDGDWGLTNVFGDARKSGQALDFGRDGLRAIVNVSAAL